MKNSIILLVSLLSAPLAGATSLHPCTPIRELAPTQISCRVGSQFYSIKVRTVGSPVSCIGTADYVERQTATVEVSEQGRGYQGKMEIVDGAFDYQLDVDGSQFVSRAFGLNLTDCVTPAHGALSFGN